eukprot:3285658-Rhodomonas_salina.2
MPWCTATASAPHTSHSSIATHPTPQSQRSHALATTVPIPAVEGVGAARGREPVSEREPLRELQPDRGPPATAAAPDAAGGGARGRGPRHRQPLAGAPRHSHLAPPSQDLTRSSFSRALAPLASAPRVLATARGRRIGRTGRRCGACWRAS